MGRSELLKDIVSGKSDLENTLYRLKIILDDLEDEHISRWLDGELGGYQDNDPLPSYRKIKGRAVGTFIVNYTAKYTNASVPLELLLPQETIDELLQINIRDSIITVQNVLKNEKRGHYGKPVPTAYSHLISKDDIQIIGMTIETSSNDVDQIISQVKSKLVKIVLELEKRFADLDSLDIKPELEADSSKKDTAIYVIENIIYEGSIEVGDKNKIKDSRFGNLFTRGRKSEK